MPDEEAQQLDTPAPEQSAADTVDRSASSVIIGSLTATGVATGGLGALAAGVAQLKDAFGGGEPAPTSEQTTLQQAQPTSADDD